MRVGQNPNYDHNQEKSAGTDDGGAFHHARKLIDDFSAANGTKLDGLFDGFLTLRATGHV